MRRERRGEEDGLRSRLRVLSDDVYQAGELTADEALCGRDGQEVCAEEEKENEENPRQPDGATGQETASSVLRCAFAVIKKKKLSKDAYAGVINNARKTADPALRPVPKIS